MLDKFNNMECDVDFNDDVDDRSITRTKLLRTLKTGEIETDYTKHNLHAIDNMDFNILIKKNPFDQDVKLIDKYPPTAQAPVQEERESRLSKEKKERASRLKEVQSSDGFVRPSTAKDSKGDDKVSKLKKNEKEMRRAISLHSNENNKPLRGILKVGPRSRFAKEFHSIEPTGHASEAFPDKRNRDRSTEAEKRGFLKSSSFDAHDNPKSDKSNKSSNRSNFSKNKTVLKKKWGLFLFDVVIYFFSLSWSAIFSSSLRRLGLILLVL